MTFISKIKKIILEAFVSKFILYVYQMLDEIKKKFPLK
jgi:hypothetical protein